jgi:ATP-dependent Lon protease
VVIEDPYIRLQHQIQNFVRFCETVLKAGTARRITLITGHDDKTPLAEMAEKLRWWARGDCGEAEEVQP